MDVDWQYVAIIVAVLVPSVILHEVSHGVVALFFGDDTAKRAGRLTLNPLRHVDPFGTVLLPLMLALSGLGAFGYAKPVPVNVGALRNPRQHSLYVSLAGPAVNIALALATVVAFRVLSNVDRFGSVINVEGGTVMEVVFFFGLINVVLAVFNLIPIPPLDGSALVERVLPMRYWPSWLKLRRWGMVALLFLLFAAPGGFGRIFSPVVDAWISLL